jgi:alanyl-tRNA synthetase
MPETLKQYYFEPERFVGEAEVLEIREMDSGYTVVLDRSLFYPEGGGQPCDLGRIDDAAVNLVKENDGVILHALEGKPNFKTGDRVLMRVDGARRIDHSQQHSGQHLLSAILERRYGIHTLSFHLGVSYSTIDITCPSMDQEFLKALEDEAEAFIAKSHPYLLHLCPPEDPNSFPFRKGLPEGDGQIRIIEIKDYDWVACCGTHVSSAADLRVLSVLQAEKYKGNTRLYFVAGARAASLLRRRKDSLQTIAAALGSSPEEAASKVEALTARNATLEAARATLARENAGLEVALRAVENTGSPSAPLYFAFQDKSAEAAFETVKAGANKGYSAVALSLPDKTVCVMVPQEKSANLASSLKAMLAQHKGRGGGGGNNFRAVFESPEAAKEFSDSVLRILSHDTP